MNDGNSDDICIASFVVHQHPKYFDTRFQIFAMEDFREKWKCY